MMLRIGLAKESPVVPLHRLRRPPPTLLFFSPSLLTPSLFSLPFPTFLPSPTCPPSLSTCPKKRRRSRSVASGAMPPTQKLTTPRSCCAASAPCNRVNCSSVRPPLHMPVSLSVYTSLRCTFLDERGRLSVALFRVLASEYLLSLRDRCHHPARAWSLPRHGPPSSRMAAAAVVLLWRIRPGLLRLVLRRYNCMVYVTRTDGAKSRRVLNRICPLQRSLGSFAVASGCLQLVAIERLLPRLIWLPMKVLRPYRSRLPC
jgi:hypothetical protein